jgi:hypothetical protein
MKILQMQSRYEENNDSIDGSMGLAQGAIGYA